MLSLRWNLLFADGYCPYHCAEVIGLYGFVVFLTDICPLSTDPKHFIGHIRLIVALILNTRAGDGVC